MKIQSVELFLDALNHDKSRDLPGLSAHAAMAPAGRFTKEGNPVVYQGVNPKLSAVLVVLFADEMLNLRLLLIQRNEYQGVHSAQVSFPGGKKEPQDQSLLETAVREAREEISLLESNIQIIRPLTELYIPPSNFLVQPYLAFSSHLGELMKDEHEVKEILTPSFHLFHEPENKKFGSFMTGAGFNVKYPYYEVEGRRIWGATAMIISELEELIKRL